MPTDVVMPQMGESIAEGTIVRWIKKVGDQVERDEPLFEISTDKVDAEIPSPAAGVLAEIRVKEGETVPVNSVVAVIGPLAAGERRRRRAAAGSRRPPATTARRDDRRSAPSRAPPRRRRQRRRTAPPPARAPRRACTAERRPRPPATPRTREDRLAPALVAARPQDREGAQRRHLADSRAPASPGRVTKDDILDFIAHVGHGRAVRPRASAPSRPPPDAGRTSGRRRARGAALPGQVQPMSVMRKKIAEHMVDEPADVGARALGLRSELRARRADPRGEEGRIRAGRREAHVHVVHHQGGGRRAAGRPGRQRVDRRRQHRLPPRHQHRHRRRARLGPDRPGDQERGRAEPARPQPGGRRPRRPRARQAAQARRGDRRHVHDHEPRRVRRAVRHADHQPAAGRDPRRRQRSRSGRS